MHLPLLAALFFYLDEIAGTAISSDSTPSPADKKRGFCRLRLRVAPAALRPSQRRLFLV
jgi:hypothetical protein